MSNLDIIIGNMFSGKTSEVIRRLKRYKVLDKKVVVINSTKDTRGNGDVIHTHDGVKFDCIKLDNIADCLLKHEFCSADVVAIDEAQFFDNIFKFVNMCIFLQKDIILAGLDGDYRQKKYGEILDCIPLATSVTKLSALCMECRDGTPGPFTRRIITDNTLDLVGGNDKYKAVCRRHLYE